MEDFTLATTITAAHYATFTTNQQKIIDRLSQQLNRSVTLEDVAKILDFEDRVKDVEVSEAQNKAADLADDADDATDLHMVRNLVQDLDNRADSLCHTSAQKSDVAKALALLLAQLNGVRQQLQDLETRPHPVHIAKMLTVGGSPVMNINVPGARADMSVIATMNKLGIAPVQILTAKCGLDLVTVTFSANPSTDHEFSFVVQY